jgi:hypothetical protein
VQVAVGWSSSLLMRQRMDTIDLSVVGEPSYSCPLTLSLQADRFALDTIRRHGQGKLVLNAWLTRGYISIEQVFLVVPQSHTRRVLESVRYLTHTHTLLQNLDSNAEELDAQTRLEPVCKFSHSCSCWWPWEQTS